MARKAIEQAERALIIRRREDSRLGNGTVGRPTIESAHISPLNAPSGHLLPQLSKNSRTVIQVLGLVRRSVFECAHIADR